MRAEEMVESGQASLWHLPPAAACSGWCSPEPVLFLAMELRQSTGRRFFSCAPKNQSTQAEERLCYNLICLWFDVSLGSNYFILKHLWKGMINKWGWVFWRGVTPWCKAKGRIAFHLQLGTILQTHCLAAARGNWHTEIWAVMRRYGCKWHQPQLPPPPVGKHRWLSCWCWRTIGLGEETQSRLAWNMTPWTLILWSWSKSSPCWLCLCFVTCKAEMNRTKLSAKDCEDLQLKAPNTYDNDQRHWCPLLCTQSKHARAIPRSLKTVRCFQAKYLFYLCRAGTAHVRRLARLLLSEASQQRVGGSGSTHTWAEHMGKNAGARTPARACVDCVIVQWTFPTGNSDSKPLNSHTNMLCFLPSLCEERVLKPFAHTAGKIWCSTNLEGVLPAQDGTNQG